MKTAAIKSLLASLLFLSINLEAQQPASLVSLGTGPMTTDAAKRTNVIDYGISVSTDFDDNATDPGNTTGGHSDLRSSIRPQTDLALRRGRFTSQYSYDPSFNYSRNIDAYNSTSQIAGASAEYFFSRHLSLQLRDTFSLTTNPYDSWEAATQPSAIGILSRPNQSAIGANTRNSSEQAQANVVYELGRHTSLGVGGTFSRLSYQTIANGSSAPEFSQESRGWSGTAFYSHQLTPMYSIGIQYTAQDISSHGSSGTFGSLSHQALGFVTVSFKPTVQLSIFAGPERSSLDNSFYGSAGLMPLHVDKVSLSGGSTLNWQGQHNGLIASFVQQVSDSGFNGGGALLVRTVSLQLQRQIGPKLSLSFVGNFVSNNQLDATSPLAVTNSASAGATISRGLSRHMALSLSAMRQQFMGNPGTALYGYLQHSHDIATVAVSYSFARPIGR